MIAQVSGIIRSMAPGTVIVDVNGLGCRLLLCPGAHERLPSVGQAVTLHTHLHVQEDALTLYGFPEQEQLAFFELLLKVSGIGPRVALGVVGATSPQEFYGHIAAGNVAALVRLPGIGRKTAQRVILDLRDKVTDMQLADEPVVAVASQSLGPGCEALMALGYTHGEAEGAIRQALRETDGDELEVQQLVTQALRHLVRI